jgi:gliding motility-associated-like protein
VIVNAAPTGTISASSTVICPGNPETLFAAGGGNYQWSNGQTTNSIQVNTAGNYTVTVSNNCGSDIKSISITQNPIHAFFTPDTTSGAAPLTVHFTDGSTSANTWSWSFGDSTFANDTNPIHIFLTDGVFIVKMVVGDGLGCYSEYQDTIIIKNEQNATVPNAFSPNGDTVNEIFDVIGYGMDSYNGNIFNRWGQMIYSWNQKQKGWDGRHSGIDSPQGTYYYIIDVKFLNGERKTLRGTVTLLR